MTHAQEGHDLDVGSLAEEATKLLGAINDWAREHGSGLGESVSGLSDHATTAAQDLSGHLATGAAECTVCPICRTVHAARHLSPEVKNHLASAAASLMHAAAGMLATSVSTDEPSATGVEHIDLDETGDAGDAWPEEDPA
ncbi:MAG: hypothetical protein JWN68_1952 [Nocardioides sp.]|uniref:hypothetical protein n=1 Tax=Nocardioides sp. TaxID=35761 RepID=UPI00262B9D90|nr:hypothetical protein [Nocardioides sp.]MCW2833999.1 hypothetical protein [Nocardioides sp.]